MLGYMQEYYNTMYSSSDFEAVMIAAHEMLEPEFGHEVIDAVRRDWEGTMFNFTESQFLHWMQADCSALIQTQISEMFDELIEQA